VSGRVEKWLYGINLLFCSVRATIKTSFDSQADLGIVRIVRLVRLFDPARFAHLQLQKESENEKHFCW
jgi:hypothetical protein